MYLTYAVYIFLEITIPCIVIFYLALIFQSTCYDVDTFLHDPRVVFIHQEYKPKVMKAL